MCGRKLFRTHTVTSGNFYAHNSGAASTTLSWATSNLRAKCAAFYNSTLSGVLNGVKDYITPYTIDGVTDYVWLMDYLDFDYFNNGNYSPFYDNNGNEVKIWTWRCGAAGGEEWGTALRFTGSNYYAEDFDAHTSLGFVPCFLV